MSYNDENEQLEDSLDTGSRIAKRGAKSAGKKMAMMFMKLAKLVILKMVTFIGLPLIILISLAIIGYFLIFEHVGTQKEYTKEFKNEVEYVEDGYYKTSENMMSSQNKTVQDFYKYFASQSFSQVSLDDYDKTGKYKFKRIDDYKDDEERISDYYEREDYFKLNENMLFALDDRLYEGFKFPEHFIKPVAFDQEKRELKDLTNKKGSVVVESEQRNRVTGKKLDRTEKSTKDYGLGSVLFYREGRRNLTVEGTYEKEDYWDSDSKRVKQRPVKEPFVVQLAGFAPEKIHVIEDAVTMAGDIKYKYEILKEPIESLQSGRTKNEGEPLTEYHYKTHYDYSHCDGKADCEPNEYPLYKYRSDDSAIVEELPRVVDTEQNKKGNRYFEDFVLNFETYVPNDVMTDKELIKRIDYDSVAFDLDVELSDLSGAIDLGLGSGIEKSKFKNALEYKNEFELYGSMFGVDPYIMMAIATQESGANPNINSDGMMQIDDAHNNQTITMNDKNGRPQSLTITASTKKEPGPSIMWATMRFKTLMDKHDGNVYKAIQEYNFGSGTMRNLEKVSGNSWNSETGWLIFREKARRNVAPKGKASASYGCMPFPEGELPSRKGNLFADSCYLENVLQYYAGGNIEKVENSGFWNKVMGFTGSVLSSIGDFLRTPVRLEVDYDEPINLSHYKPILEWDEDLTIMKLTNALNEEKLYSRASSEGADMQVNLFSSDFISTISTVGTHNPGGGSSVGLLSPEEILKRAPMPGGYHPPIDMNGKRISSPYGPRDGKSINTTNGKGGSNWHKGVDVGRTYIGEPLYAIADGRVETYNTGSVGAGQAMVIYHDNGAISKYFHLSGYFVRGGRVTKGQPVAKVGTTGSSSGPHLHFEFWIDPQTHTNPEVMLYGIKK